MDFDVPVRFLARAFIADGQNISASLEECLRLMAVVPQLPFQPQMAIETGPDGSARVRNIIVASDLSLAILGESFDVTRGPTDVRGSNLRDFNAFARTAADLLVACSRHYDRQPYRLALVQEGLMRDMPATEKDAIARRLFRFPPTFEATPPFEWDWRCVGHATLRIGGADETTNVLVTAKRMAGVFASSTRPEAERLEFDRVRVELDVNTVPSNAQPRFDGASIREFFNVALQEHDRLSREVAAHLMGDQR